MKHFVARMQAHRAGIREFMHATPDSAVLHPGYVSDCQGGAFCRSPLAISPSVRRIAAAGRFCDIEGEHYETRCAR